jgi:branched-chain amino acid transport system substrate-binding protein
MHKWYPTLEANIHAEDSFILNYWRAAHALVVGLNKSRGAVGAVLQAGMPRAISDPYQVSDRGIVKLDSRRQVIADQYQMQLVKGAGGAPTVTIAGYVPDVSQTFGGTFSPTKPAPGRTFPPCVKRRLPWQGKIQVVRNGVVTKQFVK